VRYVNWMATLSWVGMTLNMILMMKGWQSVLVNFVLLMRVMR